MQVFQVGRLFLLHPLHQALQAAVLTGFFLYLIDGSILFHGREKIIYSPVVRAQDKIIDLLEP